MVIVSCHQITLSLKCHELAVMHGNRPKIFSQGSLTTFSITSVWKMPQQGRNKITEMPSKRIFSLCTEALIRKKKEEKS